MRSTADCALLEVHWATDTWSDFDTVFYSEKAGQSECPDGPPKEFLSLSFRRPWFFGNNHSLVSVIVAPKGFRGGSTWTSFALRRQRDGCDWDGLKVAR